MNKKIRIIAVLTMLCLSGTAQAGGRGGNANSMGTAGPGMRGLANGQSITTMNSNGTFNMYSNSMSVTGIGSNCGAACSNGNIVVMPVPGANTIKAGSLNADNQKDAN